MKFLPIVLVLMILASCTTGLDNDTENNDIDNNIDTPLPSEDDFFDDMDDEIDWMWDTDSDDTSMNFENEVVEFDSAYRNPAGPVDMVVSLQLNGDQIESISANATTWDVSWFDSALQSLVGGNLQDAETFYAAWSSIASEAFNEAVKSL